MSIFRFESKKQKRDRDMQKLADLIANEAVKKFNYDPDKDPAVAKFRKGMGLPHPKNW